MVISKTFKIPFDSETAFLPPFRPNGDYNEQKRVKFISLLEDECHSFVCRVRSGDIKIDDDSGVKIEEWHVFNDRYVYDIKKANELYMVNKSKDGKYVIKDLIAVINDRLVYRTSGNKYIRGTMFMRLMEK